MWSPTALQLSLHLWAAGTSTMETREKDELQILQIFTVQASHGSSEEKMSWFWERSAQYHRMRSCNNRQANLEANWGQLRKWWIHDFSAAPTVKHYCETRKSSFLPKIKRKIVHSFLNVCKDIEFIIQKTCGVGNYLAGYKAFLSLKSSLASSFLHI